MIAAFLLLFVFLLVGVLIAARIAGYTTLEIGYSAERGFFIDAVREEK